MSNESAIEETRARLRSGACLKQEDIDLMLEDFLSPQDIHLIEQHLSGCEDCRNKFEEVYGNSAWWSPVRNHLDTKLNTVSMDEHQSDLQAQLQRMLKPSDDPSMIGRIGPYEISGIVGHGGMGAVFKGFDASLNRYVAIKMLLPHLSNSGAARKRFAREAQAAAAVVHDNVLPIYGVDQADGSPYIVMQYSRGKSLQKRVQEQGPLELAEVLRIGIQIARGLAAAHAQGLVHRDVKPANILLDGSVERVKLTDFGLARAVDDATLTRSGTITGTPQYMSPEQARGGAINFQSDLFSMGSVLYTLCTGRPPFRAENSFGVLRQITDEEPTPIRDINLNIPDWMCSIVQKLMSKQPQQRYDSADSVADLMEQALAHVQSPQIVPLPEQLRASSKRPALASWSAAMLAILAIVIVAGVWQLRKSESKKSNEVAIAPVADVKEADVQQRRSEPQPKREAEVANAKVEPQAPADWYCPDPYPERRIYDPQSMYIDLASLTPVQRELHLNESQIEQIAGLPEAVANKRDTDSNANSTERQRQIETEVLNALLTPDQQQRLHQIVFQRMGLSAISLGNEALNLSASQAKSISDAKATRVTPQKRESLRDEFETTIKSIFAAGEPDSAGLIQIYQSAKKYHQSLDDARRRAWNEVYLVLTDAQRAEVLKMRGPPVREKSREHLIAYAPDAPDFPKQLQGVDMSKVPSKWLLNDPFPQLPVLKRDPNFLHTRLQLLTSGLVDGELKLTQEQRAAIPKTPENIKLFSPGSQEPPEEVKLIEAKLGEVLTPDQLTRLQQLAVRHADLWAIRESMITFGIHSNLRQLTNYKVDYYWQYQRFVQSQFFDFLQTEIEGKEAAAIDREKILAKKRELDATLEDIHQRMWGDICLGMTPDQRWTFEKAIGPPLGAPPEEMMSASVPEDWYRLDPYPETPLRDSYLYLAALSEVQQELGLNSSQISQIEKLAIRDYLKAVSARFSSGDEKEKLTLLVDNILTPDQSERLHQLNTQRMGLSGLRDARLELSSTQDQPIGDAIGSDRTQRQSLLTEFNKSLHETFANNNPDAEALFKLYHMGKRCLQQADDSRKQAWNVIYQVLNNSQRLDYAKMRGAAPKNARPNYDTILFSPAEMNAEPPAADVDLSAVPSNCLIADPYPQLPVVRFDLTTIVTRMRLAASGLADEELKLSEDQRRAIEALNINSLPELQSKDLPQDWVDAEAKFKPILTATQSDRLRQLALRHLDLFAIMNWETFFGEKLKLEWEQTQDIRQCYFDLEKFRSYTEYQFFVFLRAEVDGKEASAIDREKILAKKKELDTQVTEAHRRTWGKIYLAMTPEQRTAFEKAVGTPPEAESAKGVTDAAPEGWYRPDPYPLRASYEPRRMNLDLASFKDVQQELGLSDSQVEQIATFSIESVPKDIFASETAISKANQQVDQILTATQRTRLNQIVVQHLGLSAFLYSCNELGLSGAQTTAVTNLPSANSTIRTAMRNELSESVKATFARGKPELDALVKLVQARKAYQQKLDDLRKQSWNEVYQWLTDAQRLEYERIRGDVPKNASPGIDRVIYVESEIEELSPLPDVDLSEVPFNRIASDPYPQLPLLRKDHTGAVTRMQLAASGLVDGELKLSEDQRTAIKALNIGSLPELTSAYLPREWVMTEMKFTPILDQVQNDRLRQLAFRRHLESLYWVTFYPGELNLDYQQSQTISSLQVGYAKLQKQAEFQLIAYIEREIDGKDSASVDLKKIVAKKKELDDFVVDAHRRIWAKIYLTMNADQRRGFEEAVGLDIGQD